MALKVTPRIANRLGSRQGVVSMEGCSADKGIGRYIVIALVIIAVVEVCSLPILYYMAGMPDYSVLGPHIERIEIKSVTITKLANIYTVTINFTNTGNSITLIDSILLNEVPYDDQGWTGNIKPVVSGDIVKFLNPLLRTGYIEPGASCSGIIEFSDGCTHIPSGDRLVAGTTVMITIHTTGGKDYDTSVILAASYPSITIVIVPCGEVLYSYVGQTGVLKNTTTLYVPVGSKILLSAEPSNLFYQFNGWNGQVTSAERRISVSVNSPMELTASFGYNYLTFTGIATIAFLASVLIIKRGRRANRIAIAW